jgi:hypothetical protein
MDENKKASSIAIVEVTGHRQAARRPDGQAARRPGWKRDQIHAWSETMDNAIDPPLLCCTYWVAAAGTVNKLTLTRSHFPSCDLQLLLTSSLTTLTTNQATQWPATAPLPLPPSTSVSAVSPATTLCPRVGRSASGGGSGGRGEWSLRMELEREVELGTRS